MLHLPRRTLLIHWEVWGGGLSRGEYLIRGESYFWSEARGADGHLCLANDAVQRVFRCYRSLLHKATINCREPSKENFHSLSNQAKRHQGA